MSDDVWNDDMAYAFSTNRTFMQILGMWPLQKKTIFTIIYWNIMIILLLSPLIFLYMEAIGDNGDATSNIDVVLYTACTFALNLKFICIIANRGRIAKNINAAAADWLSAKNDKESYKIMKEHTSTSRLITLFMLYSAFICGSLYIVTIIVINIKEIFFQDQMVNISNGSVATTDRVFIIPSGELGNKISGLQYAIVSIFQTIQLTLICTMQPAADSFYINVTLHLTGQLRVLEKRFKLFASQPNIKTNRKQFISLVNRHCELLELNQNIEDTFNLIILFQLVIVTLLIALLGLRIIVCLKIHDYVNLTKSILLLNYLFMQSLVYCYGGDFVQKGSEGILRAMFMASWFTLPATFMKDVKFAIMRSRYPFRLTGGKFFYANLEAMVYILKTAASYVSVLRVALRD